MRCQPQALDLAGVFRKALDVVGPGRLLFGTDSSWFPRGYMNKILDDQTQILRELGVDAEGARQILGGNLRRLIGRHS